MQHLKNIKRAYKHEQFSTNKEAKKFHLNGFLSLNPWIKSLMSFSSTHYRLITFFPKKSHSGNLPSEQIYLGKQNHKMIPQKNDLQK